MTSAWVSSSSTTAATAQNNITASAVANGGTLLNTAYPNMQVVTNINVGVYNGQGWLQLGNGGNDLSGQTVTIKFPQTVYCVSFYVQDIDTQWQSSPTSTYCDTVSVSGFTPSFASPSTASPYVTLSGSQAKPTNTASSSNPATWQWDYTTSANGLVMFSAPGGLTSITIQYTNPCAVTSATGVNNNNQQVWVSPLKYSLSPCSC